MPNKDTKDFDDVNGGFDFETVPTWEDVEEDKSGDQVEKTDFSTDFSTLNFGGSDTDTDATDADAGFGFNFDAMPTEQSVSADQHRGDPSAEFEEFGIVQNEHPSSSGGFGGSDDDVALPSPEETTQFDEFDQAFGITADEPSQQADTANSYYDDATDVLTNGQYLGEAADDPYAQVNEVQPTNQQVQDANVTSPQKSLISKLILPVGIGAIVIVGGLVGYNSLLSSTAPAPVVVAQAPVVSEPQFPSVLPPEETIAAPTTQAPVSEAPVGLNPPQNQPSETPELTFDLPTEGTTDTLPPVELPVAEGTTVPSTPLPSTPSLETTVPELPVQADFGQAKSGDVEAVKMPAASDVALKSDLQDVLERLASLEDKVDDLAENFSKKISVPVVSAETVETVVPSGSGLNSNALPVASIDNIDPPLKPIVIKGLTLVGVSGDTAWIDTGKDVISVKKSDPLPHGGKVEDIRQYRGDWVLVATDGIVLR